MRALIVTLLLGWGTAHAARDCWSTRTEGGSGFGGEVLEVRLGCQGAPIVIDTYSSFGELLAAPVLPARLPARLVRDVMIYLFASASPRCLAPTPICPRIDDSFAWLIEAYLRPPRAPVAPFRELRSYTPRWSPGPLTVPPSQVVALTDRKHRPLVAHLAAGDTPTLSARGAYALLAYYAHNHGPMIESSRCAAWNVFTTAHGVVVEEPTRHRSSWIFLSTHLEKLRHPAIDAAACADDLVFIERHGPGPDRELIVATPGPGHYGAIPLPDATPWRLDPLRHVLTIGETEYPFATLSRALAP